MGYLSTNNVKPILDKIKSEIESSGATTDHKIVITKTDDSDGLPVWAFTASDSTPITVTLTTDQEGLPMWTIA